MFDAFYFVLNFFLAEENKNWLASVRAQVEEHLKANQNRQDHYLYH